MRVSRSTRQLLTLALAGVLVVVWWQTQHGAGQDDAGTPPERSSRSGPASPGSADSVPQGSTDRASGLPVVAATDLPAEARETLELIDAGGPFRYERDGVVFENRERILPRQPRGYYHEYTVPTPGEDDRGARRIVRGSEGQYYWTEDHYASFERIDR